MKTLLLFLLLIITACGKGSSGGSPSPAQQDQTTTPRTERDPLSQVILKTPQGDEIDASMAYKPKDQKEGLSGVKPQDFSHSMGKLFIYFTDASRTFWMPNTYFALDIIYLDKNLEIIDIVWALPAYSGNVNSEIPRAPAITSRHVLEMKAGSPISASLRIGDKLEWHSSLSLEETLEKMKSQL